MDHKIFQTPQRGLINQPPSHTLTGGGSSFEHARISTASIVILPVTSTIPVTQAPPGAIRFSPQCTLSNPLVATAPPLLPLNQPHSSTVTHLMVGPNRRESGGSMSNGPVSIFMGTRRPQEIYTPISQRQQLIQSSMNNNYRAVMEPIHIKQEPRTDYNLVRSSQEIQYTRTERNDAHVPTGHQLPDTIEEEEPEEEPPTIEMMQPVNMTQPKTLSLMSQASSSIQIKPERQNSFVENYNPNANAADENSLMPMHSVVSRNKPEGVISSRTILGTNNSRKIIRFYLTFRFYVNI